MRHPSSSRRLRHLTVFVISAATATALAGCSADKDHTADTRIPSESPTPAGAVTATEAAKIVDHYEKVNNKANATQNERLLATVEAGQVNVQSHADHEQWKTWKKEDQEEYGSPFFYQNRRYLIPQAGTASWFAVRATSTGADKPECLLIFDKVGGTYKMTAAVYEDGTPIPGVALDKSGLAAAVDPSKPVGALAPDQLGPAFADLMATGGKKEGRKLASTQATKKYIESYQTRNKSDKDEDRSWRTLNYFAAKPANPTVYALRMADGGVLAVFPSAFKAEFLHKRFMQGGAIIPGPTERVYNSKTRPVITDEYQSQAVAVLRPSQQPAVLAFEDRMVNSR